MKAGFGAEPHYGIQQQRYALMSSTVGFVYNIQMTKIIRIQIHRMAGTVNIRIKLVFILHISPSIYYLRANVLCDLLGRQKVLAEAFDYSIALTQ